MKVSSKKAILQLIQNAEHAYNRGDLDAAYSNNFVQSDQLEVVSPFGLIRGFDSARADILKYQEHNDPGSLKYIKLKLDQLSDDYVFVKAIWERIIGGKTFHGYSSALFKHTDNGWRVIHDQDTWFKPDANWADSLN